MRALCLVLLLAAPAFAATDEEKARAQALYKQGQTAYESGDFSSALASFQEAFAALPAPGLYYNIAQCYRKLNDHEHAIEALDNFSKQQKNIPPAVRRDVKTQLAEQKKLLAADQKAKAAADKAAAKEAALHPPAPVPVVPVVVPTPVPTLPTVPSHPPAANPAPAPAPATEATPASKPEAPPLAPENEKPVQHTDDDEPLWKNPFVIGAAAGTALLAAGAGTIVVIALTSQAPTAPKTSLGTTDLR